MKLAHAKTISAAALVLVALAACNRSDPPSEELKKGAEELVDAVETGSPMAQPETAFAPQDTCSTLDGGAPFLAALGAAVEMRDTDVLVALAANDVKLGFGGVDGAANLRASLDAEGSVLWDELAEMMPMGCAANDVGGMTIPYYFAQTSNLDPFEAMIVTGTEVPLRSAPEGDAPNIANLSWREVAVIPEADGTTPDNGWVHVRVPARGETAEMTGYIRTSSLRSMIDYRLLASSRNGRWRITALLAGD